MMMPNRAAASITFVPCSTSISIPSILSLGMVSLKRNVKVQMTKFKSISNEKVQIPDILPFHSIAFPYAVFFGI
jgi:hypothetical protein